MYRLLSFKHRLVSRMMQLRGGGESLDTSC